MGTNLLNLVLAGKANAGRMSKNAARKLQYYGYEITHITRKERGLKYSHKRKGREALDIAKLDMASRIRPRLDMAYTDRSKYNGDGSRK